MFFLTAAGFRGKHRKKTNSDVKEELLSFEEKKKLLLRSFTQGNSILVKPPRAHFPKSAVDRGSGEENCTSSRPPAEMLAQRRPSVTFILLPSSLHPEAQLLCTHMNQRPTSRNMSNTLPDPGAHTPGSLVLTHLPGWTECGTAALCTVAVRTNMTAAAAAAAAL